MGHQGRTHEEKRYQRGGSTPQITNPVRARHEPRRRAAPARIRRDSLRRNSLSVGSPTSTAVCERQARWQPNPSSKPVDHVVPGGAQRRGGGDRGVEPGRVDALEPGEQRVDPGRCDRAGAPVDEHQVAVGAHEQVVVADVPVGEAAAPAGASRDRASVAGARRVPAYDVGDQVGREVGQQVHGVGPAGEDLPRRRRSPRPAKVAASRVGDPTVGSRSPSRSVAASRVSISASSARSAWRPSTSSSRSATQCAVVVRRQEVGPQRVARRSGRAPRSRAGTAPGCPG